MGDQQGAARRHVRRDLPRVNLAMRHVRGQQGDKHRFLCRIRRGSHPEAVRPRSAFGGTAGASADDHIETAVAQVEGMCPPLAAVADDRDAAALEHGLVGILIGKDRLQRGSPSMDKRKPPLR